MKHQQQGSAGKRAANSVSAGKKRFEPVRRGVGDMYDHLIIRFNNAHNYQQICGAIRRTLQGNSRRETQLNCWNLRLSSAHIFV
jgi:hypothetical protein